MSSSDDLSLENSSEIATIEKPKAASVANKQAAPRVRAASAKAKAPKAKAAKKEKAPSTVKPAEMAKKFAENTIKNFCNSYFGSIYDGEVSFTKYNDKIEASKNKQLVIDLSQCDEIHQLRDVIKAYEGTDLKGLSKSVYSPYIHTVLDYAESNKLTEENFSKLIRWFNIPTVPGTDTAAILRALSSYLHDSKKVTHKAFNVVFGDYYVKKHPERNEVHKRFVQRAPVQIMEILDAKDKNFGADLKTLITTCIKTEFKGLTAGAKEINKSLGTNAIEKIILKEENDLLKGKNFAQIRKFEQFKDRSEEDLQNFFNCYSEVMVIKNFIKYISEIDDEAMYHTKFAEVKAIAANFETAAAAIDKLVSAAGKKSSDRDYWRLIVKALTIVTQLHKRFAAKAKSPVMFTLNIINKNGVNLCIKNDKFKKGVDKLAAENANDAAINEFADAHLTLYDQLSIPKTYDPETVEIYSKLGNYIYYKWETSKPVLKITKNVRVAVGIAMLMYINSQIAVLKGVKKSVKIAIKP